MIPLKTVTSQSPPIFLLTNTTQDTMVKTVFCPICNGISWTTGSVDLSGPSNEIKAVMESHPKSDWCSCEHRIVSEAPDFPPKAGTGGRRPSMSA